MFLEIAAIVVSGISHSTASAYSLHLFLEIAAVLVNGVHVLMQ